MFHLPFLAAAPGARVVAISEPDPDNADHARKLFPQAAVYGRYEELVAQADVDAVVVCLPTPLHFPAALAALEASKHLYLEKPIALDLDEARQLLDAWRAAGTVGMTGFNFRHHPLYIAARQRIARGELGRLIGAHSTFTVQSRTLPEWKRRRETGGGVLLDLATHHIDLFRFLTGDEVEEVFASIASHHNEGDLATLQLRSRTGITLQSLFSASSIDADRFEIYGSEARLFADRLRSLEPQMTPRSTKGYRVRNVAAALAELHPAKLLRTPGHEPSFAAALQAFIHAARSGESCRPDLLDGARGLATALAAEESASRNEPVKPVHLSAPTAAGA